MRQLLLGCLFLSITVNLYFVYKKLTFNINMASDVPYRAQPKKMFRYLDGYHFAVTNNSDVLHPLKNCYPGAPNTYKEGLINGATDSQVIPSLNREKTQLLASTIQPQLQEYAKIVRDKELTINKLTERLAIQEKGL